MLHSPPPIPISTSPHVPCGPWPSLWAPYTASLQCLATPYSHRNCFSGPMFLISFHCQMLMCSLPNYLNSSQSCHSKQLWDLARTMFVLGTRELLSRSSLFHEIPHPTKSPRSSVQRLTGPSLMQKSHFPYGSLIFIENPCILCWQYQKSSNHVTNCTAPLPTFL